MERVIILKNTDSRQALTLPVTPSSYPMAAGRAVERLDMAQTGQVALPGLNTLFAGTLEFMLPARAYPFLTAGAVAQPSHYIGQLTAWSAAANVCRYIVTGTDINAPVLLGPLDYGEDDGTNDVTCKLPLYEYRYLEEAQAEKVTQNASRPVDATSEPETAGSYTVVKGDSLWAICKKIYGGGSLAYKLATANSIKNPNLIYPGQVLKWCPRRITPPACRIHGFKDDCSEYMDLLWREEYRAGRVKTVSPSPFRYGPRTEIPLGMTAKQFFDASRNGPLHDILPEEVHSGEIIEIDDGLRPYCFYVLDCATVIPLPCFHF